MGRRIVRAGLVMFLMALIVYAVAPTVIAPSADPSRDIDMFGYVVLAEDGSIAECVLRDTSRADEMALPAGVPLDRIARARIVINEFVDDGAFTWAKTWVLPETPGAWSDDQVVEAVKAVRARVSAQHELSHAKREALARPIDANAAGGSAVVRHADPPSVVWSGRVAVLLVWGGTLFLIRGGLTIARARVQNDALDAALSHDPLTCRKCGYGLAGLPVGTRACPECGVRLYPFYAPRREGVS